MQLFRCLRDGPRLGHRNDITQGLDRHALIPHFPGTRNLYDVIAFRSQDAQCPRKVFFFDQDVVCIVRGYRKDADLMFGKDPGQFRQDANERKVQDALNAESSPPVIPFYRLCRCVLCPAHQRHFFIRFPDKVKISGHVDVAYICHLADRQLVFDFLQFHFPAPASAQSIVVPTITNIIRPANLIHSVLKHTVMHDDNRRVCPVHRVRLIAPHIRFVLAELPVDNLLQLTILNQLRRDLEPLSCRPCAIRNRVVHHIYIDILAVPVVHPNIRRTGRQRPRHPYIDADEYGRNIQIQFLHDYILRLTSSTIDSSYIFICANSTIMTQNQTSNVIENLFYGIWFPMFYIRITYEYSIRIIWFTPH